MWQQIQCIFLTIAPFFISVGGFVGALRFLQGISNQPPSNGDLMAVFFAAIIGAIAGGSIGNISCPNNSQRGGWEWNMLSFFYTTWGLTLGVIIASFWMSYTMAT